MTRPPRVPGTPALPVERICAIEVADGASIPFKLPADTPTARRHGWTVFFYKQTGGRAPLETGVDIAPGVNVYDDHAARLLWGRIVRGEAA